MRKGVVYVVATPIGNLGDISSRAAQVLSDVNLIAAEDTRHTRLLLRHLSVDTPMVSFHEHNESEMESKLLQRLSAGESIALVSDAGTPLISDPGFGLIRAAVALGIKVCPVPGPSALIAALSAAGLPSDRFVFEGFAPRQSAQRREWLHRMSDEPRTWVFYESSHRMQATLQDMAAVLGESREIVVARELTKVYETFLRCPVAEMLAVLATDADQRKGEFVVLVSGRSAEAGDEVSREARDLLRLLMDDLPLSQAATLTAKATGERKKRLYDLALAWRDEGDAPD